MSHIIYDAISREYRENSHFKVQTVGMVNTICRVLFRATYGNPMESRLFYTIFLPCDPKTYLLPKKEHFHE